MKRRFATLAALLLALPIAPLAAQTAPLPAPRLTRVAIATELGTITLDLEAERAPITTANFLRYVDQRRFDGIVFYRAMRLDWGKPPNGLIQAGVQSDPKRVLKPIAHEATSKTGVLHKAGAISMARWAPGTATGDFSILLADMPGLDAMPEATDPEAKAGFAAFGHVVEGMEVARKIWDAPISATKGLGVMKGEMIDKPVRVLRVRRVIVAPQPAE